MIRNFEKDGKELTEVLFGYGSITILGKINVSSKHASWLKITHVDPPQEIGEPVDFDKVDIKKSITLPMTTKSLFHFERWLCKLYSEETEKKCYTFTFDNGSVVMNFEKYNKTSIKVAYAAVKRLYILTALMESENIEDIVKMD